MTLVQLVQMIGQMLTSVDAKLSSPNLLSSSPDWHQLYALRVHLDNQQKELVALAIQLDDGTYTQVSTQISNANDILEKQIHGIAKVGDIIGTIAQVASLVDKVLSLAALG